MSAAACALPPGAAAEVHLPSAEAWEAALRPRAVEPAPPEAGATTGVDPLTYYAPARWPGAGACWAGGGVGPGQLYGD